MCGRYGHSRENCRDRIQEVPEEVVIADNGEEVGEKCKKPYGPWLVVSGAGKKLFVRTITNMRSMYKFDMLVVIEPRISGLRAKKIINKIGFSNSHIVEAKCFIGGIWMLWDSDKIKLQIIASSKQSITALVEDELCCWVLTSVYSSPNVPVRKHFWSYLSFY
ncbi:hypothetical protein ACOSP7_027160 [Xanthoceras sorbifolium]